VFLTALVRREHHLDHRSQRVIMRQCCLPFLPILLAACIVVEPGPDLNVGINEGSVHVYVHDENGAPVNDVLVQLRSLSGAVIREGRTGTISGTPAGYYSFYENRGEYRLHVTAPDGYTIPPTQTHPVPVVIDVGAIVTVEFTLASG
jgi:hypothetical protein